jgi:hypothetical protein
VGALLAMQLLILAGGVACAYGALILASIGTSDTATETLVAYGLTFAIPGRRCSRRRHVATAPPPDAELIADTPAQPLERSFPSARSPLLLGPRSEGGVFVIPAAYLLLRGRATTA